MFTGIVQETGKIVSITSSQEGITFRFETGRLGALLQVGHSVSVDGVCLTVTRIAENWVEVDATPETLRRSNLGTKKTGDLLNLEPSLRLSDFLGGHLVQGHVDATGRVESVREEGNSWIFRFSAPEEILRYCVLKGSVTVNGISLTISGLGTDFFEVAIIPHTWEVTNLSRIKAGDTVNLEADVISKYVENHIQNYLRGLRPADAGVGAGRQS
jgi:riboflavin synthase